MLIPFMTLPPGVDMSRCTSGTHWFTRFAIVPNSDSVVCALISAENDT
jgi:hypothetical protein